ncbi:hypothetical protein, partial [Ellagibacter isourolithinifaciens]|uniref:hypothetical protein n=1 Tax=Ellagibacter isourolithinifaciens TaxID=2137581 RepID=UPI003AABEE09
MEKPILYYWAPCSTCSVAVNLADELGIELDKRDVALGRGPVKVSHEVRVDFEAEQPCELEGAP